MGMWILAILNPKSQMIHASLSKLHLLYRSIPVTTNLTCYMYAIRHAHNNNNVPWSAPSGRQQVSFPICPRCRMIREAKRKAECQLDEHILQTLHCPYLRKKHYSVGSYMVAILLCDGCTFAAQRCSSGGIRNPHTGSPPCLHRA